ncbi:TIGR04282 family arsenosugar biosynthesis glycosyltransferase [Tenacibaculum sp.]|uniref:TIGR04282 family arsenosugar biosynthesis glycosyltransferase n=1 Tax=Tenacibaculum sp. TaxID=1906242 RepID=UPI003AA92353
MSKQQPKIAILIFANSSKREAEHKFLGKGQELFDYLNKKIVFEASKTNAQICICNETHQIGATFGQRFTNALEHTFAKGFHNIIVVGNDSPNLNASHLQKAIDHLQNDLPVLGPSIDGGIYLLAINRKHFNKRSFATLPWKTPELFGALKKTLEKNEHSVLQLAYLKDIDSENDLTYFLNRYSTNNFLKYLINKILLVLRKSFYNTSYRHKYQYTSVLYNKGSPKTSRRTPIFS